MVQAAEAAYPDRGSVGVRLSMDDDLRGAGVGLSVDGLAPAVHVQAAVNGRGMTGGRAVVLAGADVNGTAWWMEVDGEGQRLVLRTRNGGSIEWSWWRGPSWSVVEVVSDAAQDEVGLEVNGLVVASITVSGLEPLTGVDLGLLWRDAGATGTVDLDEWVIASEPIGVVSPGVVGDLLSDPGRWAVLYRLADRDSVAWAEAYAQRRGVPLAQLVGLEVPEDEVVTPAGYGDLVDQLGGYLDRHGLRERVGGVLVGYGVPGYVELQAQVQRLPLASMLANEDPVLTPAANPAYRCEGDGVASGLLGGVRLGARADANSLVEALQFLDRADAIMAGAVAADTSSRLYIDTDGPAAGNLETVQADHVSFATSEAAWGTRLEVLVGDGSGSGVQSVVSRDAVVWNGLGGLLPDGFFGEPAGARALMVHTGVTTYGMASVRELVLGSAWVVEAMAAGYAAFGGASMASTVSDVPEVSVVIDRLRSGWTLAEAWHAGLRRLRTEFSLLGDPLMRVPMPKAGWDLYEAEASGLTGERLSAVRVGPLVPAEAVVDGQDRWLVAARDESGELADGVLGVAVDAAGDALVEAGVGWVWPVREGWPLRRLSDGAEAVVVWPCRLSVAGVRRVWVEVERGGSVSATPVCTDPASDRIVIRGLSLEAGDRVRLGVGMVSGLDRMTAWSAPWNETTLVGDIMMRTGV